MGTRSIIQLSCFVLLMAPVTVHAQGSMAFNGNYYPPSISAGTSKLEHASADVLNNAKQVTVCCWIYPNGLGEFGNGAVIYLDEQAGNAAFVIAHIAGANMLQIEKYPGAAGQAGSWTIPIIDRTWNAVCVRLDFSADNAPTARVNFTAVTVNTDITPIGINDQPATGYCVGNTSAQTRTWDGRIAHVQVFNTILSRRQCGCSIAEPGFDHNQSTAAFAYVKGERHE
jgi:hypothetical protein